MSARRARRVRGIIVLALGALLAFPAVAQAQGINSGLGQIGAPISGGECRIQNQLENTWTHGAREVQSYGSVRCSSEFYIDWNYTHTYFGYTDVNGYTTSQWAGWLGTPNSRGSTHRYVRYIPPWWYGQWTGVQYFRIRLNQAYFTGTRSYNSPGYYVWNIGPERRVMEGTLWVRNTL
jgi:hypothetical protein